MIPQPDPILLTRLFSRKRSIVAVIGPGGAGKTSLAVALARWAMEKRDEDSNKLRKPNKRQVMLPILIEEDTQDLGSVIFRKLKNWLGEEIPEPLFLALLKKKRFLIVVDRLTERSEATQSHLRTVHSSLPVGALLVTERYLTPFESGDEIKVFPQPLDSQNLLHFITALLQEPSRIQAFQKLKEQLDLGQKLADLIQVGKEEVPVTPLLVRLYIDQAIEASKANSEELPSEIPEVYFSYLKGVNPEDDEAPNRLTDEEMLRVGESLALLALRGRFAPREFSLSSARESLREIGFANRAELDPIARLRDNGILMGRDVAADPLLRFQLDPVAEFLGAMATARACGDDESKWQKLHEEVVAAEPAAAGFRQALSLVCATYGDEYRWACDVFVSDFQQAGEKHG